MKKSRFFRITALLLVTMLMLSACGEYVDTVKEQLQNIFPFGAKKEAAEESENTETPTAPMPAQQPMPAAEKETALRRLEYAVLCAAMDADIRMKELESVHDRNNQTYLYDYDGDGAEELICGAFAHTFDAARRDNSYTFSQSGIELYTDKNGVLYRKETMGSSYEYDLDGMSVLGEGYDVWYSTWNGEFWVSVLYEGYSSTKEIMLDADGWFLGYGKTISEDSYARIQDQQVSMDAYRAYKEDLNLQAVNTLPVDYTENRFDLAYKDSLLSSLEDYLAQYYTTRRITADADGDGDEEDLFFVSGIADYWLEHMTISEMDTQMVAYYYLDNVLRPDQERVCVLIADREGDRLVLDAYCILADMDIRQSMQIRQSAGFLWFDGHPVYLPGSFVRAEPEKLAQYTEVFGYSNCLFKAVDVSDYAGSEYLCLCQKNGEWYLLIWIVEDGNPRPVYTRNLTDTAVYLVEQGGKQCLLVYSQWVERALNSPAYISLDYTLLRIDADGYAQALDYQSVQYFENETDATNVARFFEKLRVYLVRILVIRDPYRLTGHTWMKQEEADYGSVPAEPQIQEPVTEIPGGTEDQEPMLGFVLIRDPSSWLNLREGPGTQYPCVRVDPSDPDSIVKQALGSPVTVLETIETGDAANPVWVKVRIAYADREIIGYSSKKYIRLVGEEP